MGSGYLYPATRPVGTRKARVSAPVDRITAHAVLAATMMFLLTGRLHDAVANGVFPVGKVFIGCGAVLLLVGGGAQQLAKAWKTVPMRALVGLTAAVAASVPFSYLRGLSLEAVITWATITLPIIIIIATSVRTVGDVERLLRALVLVVVCSGALILAGRGVVLQTIDGPRFSLAGSYDPNDLAGVISACTAACLWAIRDRSRTWRCIGLVGLCLAPFIIAKTGSRGGFLSLGALLLGGTLFVRPLIPRWLRLALIPAVLVAISYAPGELTSRMSTMGNITSDYNFTDPNGRIQVWSRGLGYIAARPITGVGARAFLIADGRYAVEHGFHAGFKWTAAHNIFIECAAELGLPGLVALLFALLSIVRTWRRLRKAPTRNPEDLRIQRAVEAIALVTLTFLSGAMFVSALWNPFLQMLIALSIGAHVILDAKMPKLSS